LDDWLHDLRRARFTFFYMPDREDPNAIAATYRWPGAVDVFGLFRDGTGLAYRTPVSSIDRSPFRPLSVSWAFAGDPVWAIRGVLGLPEPGTEGEPVWVQDAPPLCGVLGELAYGGYVVKAPK
jgi:hypothetical protein